jgi:alcohol dehydrogenase (NADP+)
MRSRSATDRLTAVLLGVPVREGAGTHAPAPRSFPRALVETPAYAALLPRTPLTRVFIYRRPLGPHDVLIDILYCGVCHSDIHQARDEWGGSVFPMVPGHEIVGRVGEVGSHVTKFREGEMAGVGCLVDSCRTCEPCRDGFEAFCERGSSFTSNGAERDGKTPTYGGYSTRIVVAEDFALKVPAGLDPAGAAPLLCAGITIYSPLRHWGCHEGDRVAVVGLGGLGHVAVKMAVSMGAEVTVFSTSRSKAADARDLGAQEFELTTGKTSFPKLAGRFHLVIDTVAAPHDYDPTSPCCVRAALWSSSASPPGPRPRRPSRSSWATSAWPAPISAASPRRKRCSTTAPSAGSCPTSRSSPSRRSTKPTSGCSRATSATAS